MLKQPPGVVIQPADVNLCHDAAAGYGYASPTAGDEFPEHILPLQRRPDTDHVDLQPSPSQPQQSETSAVGISDPALAIVSVDEIVLHSMDFIRHLADRHGIRVRVAIARRLPLVCCELAATRCTIANLLIRAIRNADPQRCSVFVCAYVGDKEDTVEVCVTHCLNGPQNADSQVPPPTDAGQSDSVQKIRDEPFPRVSPDVLAASPLCSQLQIEQECDHAQTYRLSLPIGTVAAQVL